MPRQKKGKTRRINYDEIGDILAKALYNKGKSKGWRKKLLESPEQTLIDRGFAPNPRVVAFIKSLKTAGFEKVAKKFKPSNALSKPSREG